MNEYQVTGNAILLICALLIAERSYRTGSENYSAGKVISLACAFIVASAAASILLFNSQSQDQQTLLRMLNNLAYFAAIPLLASAMFATATNRNWLKPTWGRWLLALLALFELSRRAEFGMEYSQLMIAASALTMLYCSLRAKTLHARLGHAIAAATLAAAGLLFGPASLYPGQQSSLWFALSLGLMLLSIGLILPPQETVRHKQHH